MNETADTTICVAWIAQRVLQNMGRGMVASCHDHHDAAGRARSFAPATPVRLIASAVFALAWGVTVGFGVPQGAAQSKAPDIADDIHLGVASCAGSTCHGSIEPWAKSNVLQNEYVTWQRQDKHAKAYEVLLNDRSKRMARNLGLADAHTAEVCLDCHADNVPADKRGTTFQISDGVGCEACHGGSVRWIGVHLAGKGHAVNVANGMYPTVDPVERAKLCLSCHFGDKKRFVTHRIMGAGHPRMSFELDTFTTLQPAHFKVDEDYARRKAVYNGVKTWAIGQALAIGRTLDLLTDPARSYDGIFPELVFFDCHACHHPMSNLRWQPRRGTGLKPGIVRLNDSNLVMLRVIARHVDEDLGETLFRETLALHAASTEGVDATVEAAKTLRKTTDKVIGQFKSHSFGPADIQALLSGVVEEGLSGEYADYAAAEQATMALGSIIDTMKRAGMIDSGQLEPMVAALDACYKAVEKDEAYKPTVFAEALRQFKSAIPEL